MWEFVVFSDLFHVLLPMSKQVVKPMRKGKGRSDGPENGRLIIEPRCPVVQIYMLVENVGLMLQKTQPVVLHTTLRLFKTT